MTAPAVQDPNAQTVFEIPDTSYYRVIGDGGCEHCEAGKMWTIVHSEGAGTDDEVAIGSSWGDKNLTEDICDLMNMAYEAGKEMADTEAKG